MLLIKNYKTLFVLFLTGLFLSACGAPKAPKALLSAGYISKSKGATRALFCPPSSCGQIVVLTYKKRASSLKKIASLNAIRNNRTSRRLLKLFLSAKLNENIRIIGTPQASRIKGRNAIIIRMKSINNIPGYGIIIWDDKNIHYIAGLSKSRAKATSQARRLARLVVK